MCKSVMLIACLILVGCGGDNDSAENSDTLWVFKNTGAIQCESSGIAVEDSAQLLIDNGVDVLSSNCGFRTGLTVPSVCGVGTADINLHKIREANLPDSESLGYFDIVNLEEDGAGIGYQVIECKGS